MRTTLFCDVQGQHSWQTQVPRKLQHTLRAHPRQSPYPIMKGILFGLLVKVARGVFLSGVLKQLYRKNTPTIYTLSVWRSGDQGASMEFTLVYHLYIAFWGVICYLPIPPTNREPETTIVTGLFFGVTEISGPLRCWCAVSQDAMPDAAKRPGWLG